jgi:hypothetical protein
MLAWSIVTAVVAVPTVIEAPTLIDGFVVLGVGAVLPLALPSRGWLVVAPSVALAVCAPAGSVAALLVVPWLAQGAALVVRTMARARQDRSLRLDRAAEVAAVGFSVVASVALLQSCLGAELLGIGEPIVELTAVHFVYAGAAALTLARGNLATRPGGTARLAVVVTAVAPPVVAIGFVTGAALAQVGGAVLMTVAVWLTAVLHLRAAREPACPRATQVLLGMSGISVWVPMALAVAWAAAQHGDVPLVRLVPVLSIADMVRVHGTANALGFTLCGLLARRLPVVRPARIGEVMA